MAVPDFDAGAMENWGLVLYREVYLLYDEVISSVYNKYSVTQVIGHELAHQVIYLVYVISIFKKTLPITHRHLI